MNQNHPLSPGEMVELHVGDYIYTCNYDNLGKKCMANNQEGVCAFEYHFSIVGGSSSWIQRYYCYTGK